MYIKEVIVHYGCDWRGCTNNGKGEVIPSDWKRIHLIGGKNAFPSAATQPQPGQHGLLCPACVGKLYASINLTAGRPAEAPAIEGNK
jgi:hypothetical protein